MKKFEPTLEHAFYALALAIAVGLRFVHLGAVPLSDYEAGWALQALHHPGSPASHRPQPGHVHLTAMLFHIFGADQFPGPFLAGSGGLWIGPGCLVPAWHARADSALILAFGLAIARPGGDVDLAGRPMLAITSGPYRAFWMDGRRAAAGFLAGLALLSGPRSGSGCRGGDGLGIRFGRLEEKPRYWWMMKVKRSKKGNKPGAT